jgi:hypothetical protein
MDATEMAGYLAALLVFLTFYMKTMVPLRIVGICSNVAFVTYAWLGDLHPILILHMILLPLNCIRLREMLRLTREVRVVTQGDLNMDWLKPFTSTRGFSAGDVLFHKGDIADAMYFIVSGRFRLIELAKDILPGQIVGELGLLAPNQSRTQTVQCAEDGQMLQITYEQVRRLYYQNPQFGFYFLQLTTQRLFENISSLERDLAVYRSTAVVG